MTWSQPWRNLCAPDSTRKMVKLDMVKRIKRTFSVRRIKPIRLALAIGLATLAGCTTPADPPGEPGATNARQKRALVEPVLAENQKKPDILQPASFEMWSVVDASESAIDISRLTLPNQWARVFRGSQLQYQRRGTGKRLEHLATLVSRRGTAFALVAIGSGSHPDCGSTGACIGATLERDWRDEGIRISDLVYGPRDSKFGTLNFHNFMINRGMCSEFRSEEADVGGGQQGKRPSFYTIICMPYIYHIPLEEQRALVNSIAVHADRL